MAKGDGHVHGRHAGELELKKLGHLLLGYLPAMGGRVQVPPYLEIEERPMRGGETCTLCGATVKMGDVSVCNRELDVTVRFPFVAVHALGTHGDRTFRAALQSDQTIDVDRLKDVLNYEAYRLGRLITGLLAHTELLPEHLRIDENMDAKVATCRPCGEVGTQVSTGSFRIANTHNDEAMEVPYLALHALVEHKDIAYEAGDDDGSDASSGSDADAGAIQGRLDIECLRRILGQAQTHADFGARLAGYLRELGGEAPIPRYLKVVEHPQGERETCGECGEDVDAGYFELRNIHTGHGMQLPFVAIHSLVSHGDAYFRGSLHRGWVDIPLIHRLVKRTWPIVQRVRRTRL